MSTRVSTITITAELTDGSKVTATQVGLAMVSESVADADTVVADAVQDGGAQLRTLLTQRGVL